MSTYVAEVEWALGPEDDFTKNRYSRAHLWRFDGGYEVQASASPQIVPSPFSNPAHVDPEEAFVASLSSCHMLWFLGLAAKQGWVVENYRDQASGLLSANAQGKLAMTEVRLRPKVRFARVKPTADTLHALHAQAHVQCFIANSVLTDVRIEPVLE